MNEELMLRVENVYKKYRLGTIGGGTLTADLQSWWARVRHKEDPNSKIGSKVYERNEEFYALNGINFEVKKGETVGLIGGNGAGKSTTLKLLSQVTAPTEGKIYLNGRIASMLEVGTGFHPELTGRENIYMNGAILGMTKAEIDTKIEDIIDFSECRKFIDTPVKRYSSGMYVKLAFSVAAHLDSEIMIMDEVLAVGDTNFQQKCINKMKDLAVNEGRTILYVSHNMNTVRALCNRCIVLERGRVIHDGDTDEAIEIYSKNLIKSIESNKKLSEKKRFLDLSCDIFMTEVNIKENDNQKLVFDLTYNSKFDYEGVVLRLLLSDNVGNVIGTAHSEVVENTKKGENVAEFCLHTGLLCNGTYIADLIISNFIDGHIMRHDFVKNAFKFDINSNDINTYGVKWNARSWGNIQLSNMKADKMQ